VEPDSAAGFKQGALVEMKERAKALAGTNQNELFAARKLEVSLATPATPLGHGEGTSTTQKKYRLPAPKAETIIRHHAFSACC